MCLQYRRPQFDSWVGKIFWRRDRLPTPVFLGFPCGSAGKRICLQCGRPGFDPWKRERLPTLVFWPGEFHGLYSSWGHKEWDTTEWLWDFPVAQMVKNLPAIQESWVQSLGQEDPLQKETATHFSILAWRIQWTEEPGGLQSMGLQKVGHNWATNTHTQ